MNAASPLWCVWAGGAWPAGELLLKGYSWERVRVNATGWFHSLVLAEDAYGRSVNSRKLYGSALPLRD